MNPNEKKQEKKSAAAAVKQPSQTSNKELSRRTTAATKSSQELQSVSKRLRSGDLESSQKSRSLKARASTKQVDSLTEVNSDVLGQKYFREGKFSALRKYEAREGRTSTAADAPHAFVSRINSKFVGSPVEDDVADDDAADDDHDHV